MISDEKTMFAFNVVTGPGRNVSDEFISNQLNSLVVHERENADLYKKICSSESMHRLLRSWCDVREGMNCKIAEAELHSDMIGRWDDEYVSVADVSILFWFMPFRVPVFSALERIHSLESRRCFSGVQDDSPIERLRATREEELAKYDTKIVDAVSNLRAAAGLLGMPENYFICRRRSQRDEFKEGEKFGHLSGVRTPQMRPPEIERYPEFLIVPDAYREEREAMSQVAEILDTYAEDLQFVARAGKPSFEAWAIRKLWAGVVEAFRYYGVPPQIDRPWATISSVLSLCNVHAESEMVRKTVKAI